MNTVRLGPHLRGWPPIEATMRVAIAAILMAVAVPHVHPAPGNGRPASAGVPA